MSLQPKIAPLKGLRVSPKKPGPKEISLAKREKSFKAPPKIFLAKDIKVYPPRNSSLP